MSSVARLFEFLSPDDFDYAFPQELIAKYPLAERSLSRLLVLPKQTGPALHVNFRNILDYLNPNDCLVFNDSKVINARLLGKKTSGGAVEILVERILSPLIFSAQVKSSKALKEGGFVCLSDGSLLRMIWKVGDFLHFESKEPVLGLLNRLGQVPIPPYMDREAVQSDTVRYQTIFAQHEGSVAAPTAGLHFDEALILQVKAKGIKTLAVTLHVGSGTFQPVRSARIVDHKIHSEWLTVSSETCAEIAAVKAKGGRVIAIGTTAARSLETAAQTGNLQPYSGETSLFVLPGYCFRVVDGLLTNFHFPRSTLLMLVSALCGRERVLAAYQEAITRGYRLFSYGDAMLLI